METVEVMIEKNLKNYFAKYMNYLKMKTINLVPDHSNEVSSAYQTYF